jgi:hypothetical protein
MSEPHDPHQPGLRDRAPSAASGMAFFCHCEERSDAAISVTQGAHNLTEIALMSLMSLVKQQHKHSPFQLCERWIFQQ